MYRTNLAAILLFVAALPSLARRTPAPDAEKTAAPIPSETKSDTSHTLRLDGKTIPYTAAAGTLLINGDDEKPNGSMFYVAYTLNGVSDMRTRPVTFLYNGGPGSASLWLHMASVGPARVLTASPEATGAAPLPHCAQRVLPARQDEYDLAYMQLEPKLRGNIEFGYYESGHMIYLNVDALKQLKADLGGFYQRAAGGAM
ncbi:MAG: hypothetical protein LC126_12640 [Bryobacterales bacterium]|nr:hypothetical protein [Bryobacterales bacterium]